MVCLKAQSTWILTVVLLLIFCLGKILKSYTLQCLSFKRGKHLFPLDGTVAPYVYYCVWSKVVRKGKFPCLLERIISGSLEETAKMLGQQVASAVGSLLITWCTAFLCKTGEVGQGISKLKCPLNQSTGIRFSFRHFTIIYPAPILPNVQSGTTLERALLGRNSQEKELEIKKKSTYIIYICFPQNTHTHTKKQSLQRCFG